MDVGEQAKLSLKQISLIASSLIILALLGSFGFAQSKRILNLDQQLLIWFGIFPLCVALTYALMLRLNYRIRGVAIKRRIAWRICIFAFIATMPVAHFFAYFSRIYPYDTSPDFWISAMLQISHAWLALIGFGLLWLWLYQRYSRTATAILNTSLLCAIAYWAWRMFIVLN